MRYFKIFLLAVATFSLNVASAQKKKIKLKDLKTTEEKAAYALGQSMVDGFRAQLDMYAQQFDLDTNIVKTAFLKKYLEGQVIFDSLEANQILQDFGQYAQEKKQRKDSLLIQENVKAGETYIEQQMKANSKLIKTESGLVYEVIQEGTGKKPTAANTVAAKYKGMLIDGTVFDESKGNAIEFPLSGVIKGWTEGLQLMNEGAKYLFIIPAHLAYGNQERPPHIKPGSTLIFEVELVEVK